MKTNVQHRVMAPAEHQAAHTGFSVSTFERARAARNDMLRQLVIEHRRIDILCEYILRGENGDHAMWFHQEMLEWQDQHEEGMILAFRGARKTSYLTIARAILEILCDANVRILFTSDAADQAKTFLRGVKSHFEQNEELREVFGDYSSGAPKWADGEIIVNRRTAVGMKEGTITCVGMETALLGRHFDVIIADDLVTDENSLTEGQREKVKNFYYKTLLPALEPKGRQWIIGTRWHEEDLYGWLGKEDFKGQTYRLGILDEETDHSIWEEVFPTERMHRIRRGSLSAFELQWMCRSGVNFGGIFSEDHFRFYEYLPAEVFKWQGVDLAAGQKSRNDFFAHVSIACCKKTRRVFLLDFVETRLPFPKQVHLINLKFRKHPQTVRIGIEANAYQVVLAQMVQHWFPDVPVVPRWTLKDKVARAQQLATVAGEGGPFFIHRNHTKFLRRMVAFPHGPKDLFDAFDIAVGMALRGVRKRREKEPGLL
jgi:hypothetical protein